jgi:hypothetical protein
MGTEDRVLMWIALFGAVALLGVVSLIELVQ